MNKKLIFGLLGLAVGIAAYIGFRMYHKKHFDIAAAQPVATLSAEALFKEFDENEESTNQRYLGKVIQISGTVEDVQQADDGKVSVNLNAGEEAMFGIQCNLDEFSKHKRTAFQKGEQVTFRCVCTGKLMDVVLVRCVEL